MIRTPSSADAEPQHRARGELDARDAAAFLVQEVERHAEQQREQHHRRGVMLREPRRRERDRPGAERAGIDRVDELRLGPRCETRRRRARSMATMPSMLS